MIVVVKARAIEHHLIITLVLLVLVSFVMCFVMKIYSILRAPECSFHLVHDIEIDATNTDRVAHLFFDKKRLYRNSK